MSFTLEHMNNERFAVEVHGLTKRYGRRTVVDDVDLTIPQGGVTGLVGPNGAGKTTIMSMLLGLVRPNAGHGTVLGQPMGVPTAYLHRVGALIEGPAFHPNMTGSEALRHLATLGGHDRSRIPGVLALVGLTGRAGDTYRSYSLGMKQRLGIAASLLGDPELVILDEPTNGVDPAGMRDIRAMVRHIADEGRSVLVSSHLLSELEAVCDHLVVIDRGGLQYAGALGGLPSAGAATISMRTRHEADLHPFVELLRAGGLTPESADGVVRVPIDGLPGRELAADINERAHAHGITLSELHEDHDTLEDRVLALVAEGDRS